MPRDPTAWAHALVWAATCLSFSSLQAFAQDEHPLPEIEEVYVWGLREEGIGRSVSASQGVVDYAAFADRPLLRVGELLEVVPGLAATQHSGTGKANQYFVRGFNIDHGTDFSVSLEGVPWNLPSHGHGQGYLDLNPIAPELVQTIYFRKGPYFADAGDFSSAGTVAMELFQDLPQSFAQATGGAHGYWRFLGAARLGQGAYAALDLTTYDGPWLNPENLRKGSFLARISAGGWFLTGLAYSATWNSADQIPQRAIDAGVVSRFGFVDPTDGGKTSRFLLSARRTAPSGWDFLAYVQNYALDLWSNFTYFLDDPANGDQFAQNDRRWVYGGSISRSWNDVLSGWNIIAGTQARWDDIGKVALYRTVARNILSTVRSDSASEWAGALWLEAAQAFGPIRATLGGRFDAVGVRVSSDNPMNSGSASDALVSPKLALAWQLSSRFELYADAGRGFHSNDARGATISVEPNTGLPAERVSLLVPSTGAEFGTRWESGDFSATASLWWLHLDSELVFVGDAGNTEASNPTGRKGGEVLFTWKPVPRMQFDISAATTYARFLGNPPHGSRIPNALEYIATGGVSVLITDELVTTLTLRHLGTAPLVEDNSARSSTASVANLLLRYHVGRFTLTGEVLNLFDSAANDIQYFYSSRLVEEPIGGIGDFHVHPAEPRTWRLGFRMQL